ncbi:secreted antigen 3 [Babesia divergens]|uniref:Secreted antigen 3 n=1 Tax=Babesia divergens TaxID=32595 RepID=A0AAD9GLA9_BABDI|nr:secreted antigen 3 [Babesia divergens]
MGDKSLERTLQGGQWKNQNVNGSGASGQKLSQWLTDEKSVGGYSDTRTLTPGLIKRGFPSQTSKLTSNTGETVADNIKNIITHNTPGPLQKVLLYLLLVCPWDNALLGHALCFVTKFCSKVSAEGSLEGKLKGYSGDLKTVCQELQRNLTPLVNGTYLSAVCQKNTKLFDGIWDDKNFDKYCDWLKRNLHYIIEALKAMAQDCKNWGSDVAFQMGFTAGPFLYGFVPKERTWQDRIKENLQGPITSLIEPLEKLEKALQTSSSAGATAGGVFTGLFGLGGAGAGAAYATNAFGFQNFISGLISGFLK